MNISPEDLTLLLFKGDISINVPIPKLVADRIGFAAYTDYFHVESIDEDRVNIWTLFGWQNELARRDYWERYTSKQLEQTYLQPPTPIVKRKSKDALMKELLAASQAGNVQECIRIQSELNAL